MAKNMKVIATAHIGYSLDKGLPNFQQPDYSVLLLQWPKAGEL